MWGKWTVLPDRRTGKVEQSHILGISAWRIVGMKPAPWQVLLVLKHVTMTPHWEGHDSQVGTTHEVLPYAIKISLTSQTEPMKSIYPWVSLYSQNVYKVPINMEWSSWVISPRTVWKWLSYWALTLWGRVFSPKASTIVPQPSQASWVPVPNHSHFLLGGS